MTGATAAGMLQSMTFHTTVLAFNGLCFLSFFLWGTFEEFKRGGRIDGFTFGLLMITLAFAVLNIAAVIS